MSDGEQLLEAIESASDLTALEQVRVAALGKSGTITALLKGLGAMDPDTRAREAPAPPPVRDTRRADIDRRPVAASAYIVQPGDTLDRIADRTGATAAAIIRANDMVSPYIVHPGQSLLIPGRRNADPPTAR